MRGIEPISGAAPPKIIRESSWGNGWSLGSVWGWGRRTLSMTQNVGLSPPLNCPPMHPCTPALCPVSSPTIEAVFFPPCPFSVHLCFLVAWGHRFCFLLTNLLCRDQSNAACPTGLGTLLALLFCLLPSRPMYYVSFWNVIKLVGALLIIGITISNCCHFCLALLILVQSVLWPQRHIAKNCPCFYCSFSVEFESGHLLAYTLWILMVNFQLHL